MTGAPIIRRIVPAEHPHGLPVANRVRLENVAVPQPGDDHVELRTRLPPLDPSMRNPTDPVGPGDAPPVVPGATVVDGTSSRVASSQHPELRVGDVVPSPSRTNGVWHPTTSGGIGRSLLAGDDQAVHRMTRA